MPAAPRAASAWLSKPSPCIALAAGVTGDFSRARRIVKTDEFSSVFRLKPAFRTAHFVLYTRSNELAHARLGIVAAKRFAPRAVTRNTIKRIARELFRQASLPAMDCIIRLSKPVNSKTDPARSARLKADLRAELLHLLLSRSGTGEGK